MALDDDLRAWLLDSDPALRWQVERDLLGADDDVWQATRARVTTEGFGARLLSLQDPDGRWAGGAFFPAGFDVHGPEAAPGAGQPWTATTWSLTSLHGWGVDAAALEGTAPRLDAVCRWEYDDLPYWGGEVDACINAMTLANGAWLGADVSQVARWFLEHRMADGGWNCEWVEGSVRSSVRSTLASVRGLLGYETTVEAHGGPGTSSSLTAALRVARHAGEEYLLARRLMFRLSTGEQVAPWVTELAYPVRSSYSVLAAADHLRAASLHDARPPDPRVAEAVEVVRAARQPDGTWLQGRRHPGRVWFEVDVPAGEPSRWLTLHALRVLDWWDAGQPATGV